MTKLTDFAPGDDDGASRRRIHLQEISGDSEMPLETVGQDLRAARLRRGDDLATVSATLKIRKDHLEAVEQDQLARLPGKTYAIGFVRSYAGYLGLDATQMVNRFKQEIAGRHDDLHAPASTVPDDDSRRLPYGWRIVALIVGLALLYGIYHLVWGGIAPQQVPSPPVIAPTHAAAPAVPEPLQQAAAAPADDAAANSAQDSDPAQAVIPSTPAASSPAPVPVPASSPPQTSADAPLASAGHVYGGPNKNPRVVLRARADTHVVVRTSDGALIFGRDMKAGDSYNVANMTGLQLSTSNAGAVEVDLDGQSMGRAGTGDAAGTMGLDPQDIVDRASH